MHIVLDICTVLCSSICSSNIMSFVKTGGVVVLRKSEKKVWLSTSIFSTGYFIGCTKFTNWDYCFELRSFSTMRQLNTGILTNSVEAFSFENQNS